MYSNAISCILCENALQIICQTHVFQLGFSLLRCCTVLIICITDTLTLLWKKITKHYNNHGI